MSLDLLAIDLVNNRSTSTASTAIGVIISRKISHANNLFIDSVTGASLRIRLRGVSSSRSSVRRHRKRARSLANRSGAENC
jgi:hypothetical protein